jgi:hypothetical protein
VDGHAGHLGTLRPPVGQLTSARRLAASGTPALVARTITKQLNLLIPNYLHQVNSSKQLLL